MLLQKHLLWFITFFNCKLCPQSAAFSVSVLSNKRQLSHFSYFYATKWDSLAQQHCQWIIKYWYLMSLYRYNIATQTIRMLCCVDFFPHPLICILDLETVRSSWSHWVHDSLYIHKAPGQVMTFKWTMAYANWLWQSSRLGGMNADWLGQKNKLWQYSRHVMIRSDWGIHGTAAISVILYICFTETLLPLPVKTIQWISALVSSDLQESRRSTFRKYRNTKKHQKHAKSNSFLEEIFLFHWPQM